MIGRLTSIVVIVLAITTVYKLVSLRRQSELAQFALAGVFVFLTLGVAPFTPWYRQTFGDPAALGWGQVAARVLVVAAASSAQSYLLLLARPFDEVRGKVTTRLLGAGVVAALFVVLALSTPSRNFGTAAFEVWPEALTHLVFQVFLSAALADVALASTRWARATAGVVRVSLRLVAVGSVLGLVYSAGKVLLVFLELRSGRNEELVTTFQVFALAGLLLVAAGSALPSVVKALRSLSRTVVAHRQLDVLYPLWNDVVTVMPEIALEPVEPRWRDRLHVRDLDLRLYRRVIEIRDGQLALVQPPRDQQEPGTGVTSLQAALSGVSECHPATVEDEVEWWTQVAASYSSLRGQDVRMPQS